MTVVISERVRGYLYVFCGVGSIVATYLGATGVIGAPEMAAWTGFTVFVAGLARFNLSTPAPAPSSLPSSPPALSEAGQAGQVTEEG